MQQNLYITQNAAWAQDISIANTNGASVDITDFVPVMYITKYFGSETKYNVPTTIFNGPGGIVRASINSVGTGMLPYGVMQYTLYLTPPENDTTIVLNGQAIIVPAV